MKKTQLLLITGEHPQYEDGDILVAFNSNRIKHIHAQHICWPRFNGKKVGGMTRGQFPLLQEFMEKTKEYRFERVSKDEVKRTSLISGEIDIVGSRPNAKGEVMDVGLFVARRKAFQKLPMFGMEGAEIWYGGKDRSEPSDVDNVWVSIKEKTGKKPEDHEDFEFTPNEKREFLHVNVEDTTNEEANALVAPLLADDEEKTMIKNRKRFVDWKIIDGVNTAYVLDKGIEYEIKDKILGKNEAKEKIK